MKAKIKKTGEILELASYAKLTFNACNSYGDPITLAPEEVELIQDTTEDEHWQEVRERVATMALVGILADGKKQGKFKDFAKMAVKFADALVEELKEK